MAAIGFKDSINRNSKQQQSQRHRNGAQKYTHISSKLRVSVGRVGSEGAASFTPAMVTEPQPAGSSLGALSEMPPKLLRSSKFFSSKPI